MVNWPKLAQTIPPFPSITASESAKLWWVIAHPWKTFAVITTIEITILANNKILDRKLSRFIVGLCKKLSGQFLNGVEIINIGYGFNASCFTSDRHRMCLNRPPTFFLRLKIYQVIGSKEIMLKVLNSLLNIQKF